MLVILDEERRLFVTFLETKQKLALVSTDAVGHTRVVIGYFEYERSAWLNSEAFWAELELPQCQEGGL